MNILQRTLARLGYTKTQPIERPTQWQLAQANGALYDLPPLDLPERQAELYQRLTWVQIAVGAVASTAATTTLSVKQLSGEDEEDIPNHSFEMLLDRPNPLQSRYEFLESVAAYRALTGNAYVWLNRTNPNQPPSEMWIIPPYAIQPVPDDRLYLRGYLYTGNRGEQIPLELHEVVHFKKFHPLSPFIGLSPIEALATVAVGDMAMTRWNTNFFDKDNAKVPGLLAFGDPIGDSDWQRLKDDINDQHGGTRRRLMMLRNVGKGGVEWVSTAMSQVDMQFLEARAANKEEIYAMFAPGLASILAINATEANALAGRRTFIEMAVWPELTSIAEKITNDILPSYGPNLRAEFDDIRITDKAMALAEQAAFATVATVDEIRQKYYQLQPIGDERGALFPAQVTGGAGVTPVTEEMEAEDATVPMGAVETENETDESDTEEGDADPTRPSDVDGQEREVEAARFRRWAKKRPHADPSAFKSDILTEEDKADILEDAEGGTLPPFTRKAAVPLDPNDPELEQRIRENIEKRTKRLVARSLAQQKKRVLQAAETIARDDFIGWAQRNLDDALTRDTMSEEELYDALRKALQESADLGVSTAVLQLETIGMGVDWTAPNLRVAEWVNRHTSELYDAINTTTGKRVRTAINEWIQNGQPLDALSKELTPVFGARRAELISSTEVTRAFSHGSQEAYKESGVVSKIEFRTAADERVCPVCGPRDRMQTDINNPNFGGLLMLPPLHPRCRCWIVPVIED